eukprot:gnl/MRDRNA2_/MRDRNA2_99760_c0_seq1.p1 gnl/MRDRNA2_/MRDRNA2_99760_c0~~gnl/MRDRNA2_/MRDRNA2_99760_c0_seq1.p1  ORF type:complete len:101 (-),score=20.39 gnl/MRDRNA2_/MRDRNA2_99760_c0_seq1:38-340(-)
MIGGQALILVVACWLTSASAELLGKKKHHHHHHHKKHHGQHIGKHQYARWQEKYAPNAGRGDWTDEDSDTESETEERRQTVIKRLTERSESEMRWQDRME